MLTNLDNASNVKLPGQAFYPQEVYAKPFNVLQIKSINNIIANNDSNRLINLVGECINYDIKELYQDDFWYLLHWLRIQSYMNFPHIIPWQCPDCDHRNNSVLTNENLTYNEIPEDYKDGEMKIILDNFPDGLYIRPQKVKDDIICQNFMKKKMIKEDDLARSSIIMDLLLLTNPKNDLNLEQLYNMFVSNKFTTDDFATIQVFRDTYTWGVTDIAKFKCDKCGEEVDVEYSFSLLTFLSKNHDRTNLRKRILAGVPTEPASDTI